MAFQLEMKLSRMALLAYAVSLWKKGAMSFKLKQFYYPYGRRGKLKFLRQLIDEVVQKIDPASLPAHLYDELVAVVKDVAFRRYDWFNFLRRKKIFRDFSRRQLYDKYMKEVFWTHYGTIDEVKILKESWLNMPNVDLVKMYVLACSYCDEELIDEIWKKIPKNRFKISREDLCNRSGFHLVVYWNKLRENKLQDFVNDCILPFTGLEGRFTYDSNLPVEANMLRLSISKGYVSSVKYFWDKLGEAEKNSNIEFCIILAMEQYDSEFKAELCRRDQFAEIIFFLLNFLNEPLKKKIFTFCENSTSVFADEYKYKYLKILMQISIDSWPWYDFFGPLLNEFKDILNGNVYKYLLNEAVTHHTSIQTNVSQNLVHQIWNKIPSELVTSAVESMIHKLFKSWDIPSMKLMFNNKNLNDKCYDAIRHIFHRQFRQWLQEGEMNKITEFILEILIPETWDKNVQNVIKSIYLQVLKREKINWSEEIKSISNEELESVKSKIDHEIIVYYLIVNNDLELADDFLIWKFEDVEKIKEFKSGFEKNVFVRDSIRSLWKTAKGNVELAKKNSDNFLVWLLMDGKNSEVFKSLEIWTRLVEVWRLDLLNESGLFGEYKYSSLKDFLCTENIEMWEDFLRWNSFDDETIDSFKIFLRDNRLPEKFKDLVTTGCFEEANKICKWVFGSEEEKMYDFMRKNLLSDDGRLAWKLYISKYSFPYNIFSTTPTKELIPKFENFIKFWREIFKTFDSLKKELNDWLYFSKEDFEKIRSDDNTSDECYSDQSTSEVEECEVYCKKDYFRCFMRVLKKAENDP